MQTMENPITAFRQGMDEARTKSYDKLDQKALDKARRRGQSTATILATGRKEYEALLNRGWTLVAAQGLGDQFQIVRRFEMTKRVLGH
jgi:hypothetical protein